MKKAGKDISRLNIEQFEGYGHVPGIPNKTTNIFDGLIGGIILFLIFAFLISLPFWI